MNVVGLGYDVEYFRFDDDEVVHAAVPHVDLQVRALAPVWLPHIAPTPLCGLGGSGRTRQTARRAGAVLCLPCTHHLRDLDEWVRAAEASMHGGGMPGFAAATGSRVHAMPF